VRKTVDRRRAVVGDRLRYTVTVTNAGPDPSVDVRAVITPSLPVRVLSARAGHGSCTTGPTPIHCRLGTLRVHARARIQLTVIPRRGGVLRAAAGAIAGGWNADLNTSLASVSTIVQSALRARITTARRTLAPGRQITFSIRVQNPNINALRNVRACLALPAGMMYLRSTPRAQMQRGQRCWTIRRLGPDPTLNLTARALRGASGALTARATITAPGARTARAHATIRLASVLIPPAVTG